jgi:hypothetical protein
MSSSRKDAALRKAATTRHKAGRVLPQKEAKRGRVGKRPVRAPRSNARQGAETCSGGIRGRKRRSLALWDGPRGLARVNTRLRRFRPDLP